MRQIILILALIVGTTSFAQQRMEKRSLPSDSSKATIKNRVERMTEELDLSSDQQRKLEGIIVKHDELVKNNQGNDDKLKTINEEMEREYRSVLTPEQIKKFDELKKGREIRRSRSQIRKVGS